MCAVSPQKCREFENRRDQGETITIEEYRNSAIKVAITQPIALLSFKLPYFWKAWGGSFDDFFKQTGEVMFNTLLFISILIVAVLRIIQNRSQGLVEATIFSALFVGSTLFCFIVHFEARYLLPIKLFGVLWILVVMTSIGRPLLRKAGMRLINP